MIQGRRNLFLRLPLLAAAPASAQAQRSRSLEARLFDALARSETVNTHEHIIPEQERTSMRVDFYPGQSLRHQRRNIGGSFRGIFEDRE